LFVLGTLNIIKLKLIDRTEFRTALFN